MKEEKFNLRINKEYYSEEKQVYNAFGDNLTDYYREYNFDFEYLKNELLEIIESYSQNDIDCYNDFEEEIRESHTIEDIKKYYEALTKEIKALNKKNLRVFYDYFGSNEFEIEI